MIKMMIHHPLCENKGMFGIWLNHLNNYRVSLGYSVLYAIEYRFCEEHLTLVYVQIFRSYLPAWFCEFGPNECRVRSLVLLFDQELGDVCWRFC